MIRKELLSILQEAPDHRFRPRNIIMILIGVLILLLKSWWADSISELLYSHLGNVSVSFAVYYLVGLGFQRRIGRPLIVLSSLVLVDSFELTDGFGFMSNVYDPFDYLANALGIALAYLVDLASTRLLTGRHQ